MRVEVEDWLAEETGLAELAETDLLRALELAASRATGDDVFLAAPALAFLLGHAQGGERERLRERLCAIAAGADEPDDARDAALRALVSERWEGKLEWVYGLLADEDLHLAPFAADDPDRMTPALTAILAAATPTVRGRIVGCAWLPAHDAVLVERREGEHVVFVLLDPATGDIKPLEGDFRPLQDRRSLQPTGRLHEYWAAQRREDGTEVGRYDARAFAFTPVRRVSGLEFSSDDMWVDGQWLYVVYAGDLLRLPLEKER